MIFFDGAGTGLGLGLIALLFIGCLALATAQVIVGFLQTGRHRWLYPAQAGLAIAALTAGQKLPLFLPVIAMMGLIFMIITGRANPDLRWFSGLSGMATLGYCAWAYLTI